MYVDYSRNNFSSSIPLYIGNSLSLDFFSLGNNRLTGIIPESICNASYLQVLDFSNNALSGTIPPCLLEHITNLGVLNLGNNKLHGVIPDAFPTGSSLQTLDLSENKLQGRLPKSLVNCDLLEVLNVGNNRLVDSFPSILMNSSSLRVLVLRSNGFYGDFQCDATSNSWHNLQIIDIASNKFTGELGAECLSNWKGMMAADDYIESGHNHIQYRFLQLSNLYYQDTVTITNKGMEMKLVKILRVYTSIDFSSNRFQGVIPDMDGNLSALYVLNLSHNSLEGPIPKSIGKLQMLGSLDLSSNQISGEIPVELENLTFLSVLNLSFNKLFGRIPSGNQFQTFSAISFKGNRGLCGFPLNNSCESNGPDLTPPPTSQDDSDFDWKFIFAAVGYLVGAANTIALLWFYEPVKIWFDIRMEKCLLWFSTM
ncbi:receptor-like protein 49 [Nicotiana tabacum]|uniref:Receptor-like protein 49 n=1 Tax=Nicotiana tabacum TaxID=4097 RepID=A0AC58S4A4_TOBAC